LTFTIKDKDEESYDKIKKIYEEYRSLMLHIAKTILKDHALAEDAVSDSIIKLIRHIHKIENVSSAQTRSFVVVIVRNTAIDIYNKLAHEGNLEFEAEELSDNSQAISDSIISKEGYKLIVDIIKSLPDTLRDVAVLSLIHDLSNKEIADITGVSYDTIRKRLSRAKRTIKEIWLRNKDI
jgi:RNA polymerase sigma-70 factor (ECF subfamily)